MRGLTLVLAFAFSGGLLTAVALIALEALIAYLVVSLITTVWFAASTDTTSAPCGNPQSAPQI